MQDLARRFTATSAAMRDRRGSLRTAGARAGLPRLAFLEQVERTPAVENRPTSGGRRFLLRPFVAG